MCRFAEDMSQQTHCILTRQLLLPNEDQLGVETLQIYGNGGVNMTKTSALRGGYGWKELTPTAKSFKAV